MGEPILSGPDIPTKLLPTKNKAVVQAELAVEGLTWHATCVSMGNPHCVTFGAKELKVINLQIHILFISTCFFSKLHILWIHIWGYKVLLKQLNLELLVQHSLLHFVHQNFRFETC